MSRDDQCKFCGLASEVDLCPTCVPRYLRCQGCGYVNTEYNDGRMKEILRLGTWRGMPADCLRCGAVAVNKKVKAVGLPQENFTKLSGGDSFIRRRLCKMSN